MYVNIHMRMFLILQQRQDEPLITEKDKEILSLTTPSSMYNNHWMSRFINMIIVYCYVE